MAKTITTAELKTLIQEIVQETITKPDYFANARKAEEIIKSLIARGAKNNRTFRKYVTDLRYQAKLADMAEVDKEVAKTIADRKKKTKRQDKYEEPEVYGGPPPSYPPIPYGPEDWARWTKTGRDAEREKYKEPVGKMSPELRAKFSAAMKKHFAKKRGEEPQSPTSSSL